MDENEFAEMLSDCTHLAEGDMDTGIRSVKTFEESGLATRNQGLVFRVLDGSEFQVTVVKSR